MAEPLAAAVRPDVSSTRASALDAQLDAPLASPLDLPMDAPFDSGLASRRESHPDSRLASDVAADLHFAPALPARSARRATGPFGGSSLMPALTDLKATTLFMKRSSLIAQLLKLRQQLLDAEVRSGDQYGYLIDQVDRIILDVRAARVDNVGLPGSNDAKVHMLPG